MIKSVRLLVLLAALPVVLISGCIERAPEIPLGVKGLDIKSLYTEPLETEIRVGEDFNIFLEVQNIGGSKAKNVVADLYGLFWVPERARPALLRAWADRDEDGDGRPGTTIFPPDPLTGSPGGIKTATFRPGTPMLAEGARLPITITARVTFDYGTSGTALLTGYSRDRYDRDLARGRITRVVNEASIPVTQTLGPIQISVVGPDKMVVPPYPPHPYEEFVYRITFRNIGDGVPITYGKDGLIVGGIWVQGPGVYLKDCLGLSHAALAQPYWIQPGQPGYEAVNTMLGYYNLLYQRRGVTVHYWKAGDAQAAFVEYTKPGEFTFSLSWGELPHVPRYRPDFVMDNLRYPMIIDTEFMGIAIPPIKLRRGESIERTCTLAIDNVHGWRNREYDTITLNFDLRYTYYVEENLPITITAPIIKVPPAPLPPSPR